MWVVFDKLILFQFSQLLEVPYYRFEDLDFVSPNRRFGTQLQTPHKPLYCIRGKHFITYENLTTPTRFVVFLPEHRFGKRVEIDMEHDPEAIESINHQLYLYGLQHELDPIYITLELCQTKQPRDDNYVLDILQNFDYLLLLIRGFAWLKQRLFSARISYENFKTVLPYFVIFFIIGLLTAIVP